MEKIIHKKNWFLNNHILLFLFLYKYLNKKQNNFLSSKNEKKNIPKISVFLPIYNGEKTIKKVYEVYKIKHW